VQIEPFYPVFSDLDDLLMNNVSFEFCKELVRCLPLKINAYGSIQKVILEAGGSLLFSKPPSRLSPQNKRRPIALLLLLFREKEKTRILNCKARILLLDVDNSTMVYLYSILACEKVPLLC
jgi:hypothetical protein